MLRTTVIGSLPFPGWLEFASQHLTQFGDADRTELLDDAVTLAIRDQLDAGLDVLTNGEQTRLDFNLSFYGFLEGLELESASPRRFGPPAHDQRGKHKVIAELRAPRGLGTVADFERLTRLFGTGLRCNSNVPPHPSPLPPAEGTTPSALASRPVPVSDSATAPSRPARTPSLPLPAGEGRGEGERHLQSATSLSEIRNPKPEIPTLKASVPGPYTLSGRLLPNAALGYPDRWALTEALLPLVRAELESLVAAGCTEISVDEPSMSCYAHREDPRRFVDIFNRTVETVTGRARICTHLCFGNYKGRAVGPRQLAPMFPAFLDFKCDEMHVEMASREFAELELLTHIARRCTAAVGLIDVKSYYLETPDDIARRVRRCLEHAPADRLAFAPDCGLSQTARWAAKQKLKNLVTGVHQVRKELGV